jgi:hypothetical protein
MGVVPPQSEFPRHITQRWVRKRHRGSAPGQSESPSHSTQACETGSQTPRGEAGTAGGAQSVESRQPTQAPAPVQYGVPGSLAHEIPAHDGWQAWSPGQHVFPPAQSAEVAQATQEPRTQRGVG